MQLILLPGMDGTGDLFEAFVKCIPPGNDTRIVAYPDQVHLSYVQLEELVVRELPTSGKYVVIAESFSGPIALQIANRGLDGLVAVVLVSSFPYRALGWKGSILAWLPFGAIFRLPLSDFALRRLLLDRSVTVDEVRRVRQVVHRVSPWVLAGRLKDVLTSDYGKRPVSGKVRVAAIFAEQDRLLGRCARESLAAVCPQAEVESVSAPHLALQVAPLAVVQVLRRLGIVD